ncbi:hypothetical protein AB834_02905 [PVC group bacterium (ex Bugula neritina AB1)]|nr:hypothetical protein AB834_02905 [PVC group bacterium (ex Bugula neritina AB1)]
MKYTVTLFLFIIIFTSGCADHNISLQTNIDFLEKENFKNQCKNQKIYLKIIDDRPSDIIGKIHVDGAEIRRARFQNEIEVQYENFINLFFKKNGFQVVSNDEERDKDVILTIREISYRARLASIEYNTYFKIDVQNLKNQKKYFQQYRSQKIKKCIFLLPNEKENNDYINKVIDESLKKLTKDKNLIKFLSN